VDLAPSHLDRIIRKYLEISGINCNFADKRIKENKEE
jgi:hypothetical protein